MDKGVKKMFQNVILPILGIILLIILVTFAMAFPFMWMWNYAIVKAITVASPITYWPAYWMMLFINLWIGGSRSSSN